MQKFATPTPVSALLDIPAGRIRFIAADRSDAKAADQITVTYDDGDGVLRIEAGQITVGAARGVSASLDAGTGHGRIHNALKNTDGADAALTIHATTARSL
ncbi:hypothetical protein [Streptomyces sp. V4I2]|uniref:hypothetical protein n=1 Tax=Streptomyces sp. V4I2 TaxID=3042280 RepID=UPI00277E548F|nr:hypothetical protein [Streptomyces sp. V4I2]MDQ1051243.1 hypothetical protein [Streptomyces sp. V4I2]